MGTEPVSPRARRNAAARGRAGCSMEELLDDADDFGPGALATTHPTKESYRTYVIAGKDAFLEPVAPLHSKDGATRAGHFLS
ncbi:hypothetical protein GCM10022403_033890 [Streptomyces coacervatus]|uniref:Uncharacterized protein n=1 Tax=Streptomyces coacervatus TaxID=647381 RepID=A0ABP7HLP5_9ACTN